MEFLSETFHYFFGIGLLFVATAVFLQIFNMNRMVNSLHSRQKTSMSMMPMIPVFGSALLAMGSFVLAAVGLAIYLLETYVN